MTKDCRKCGTTKDLSAFNKMASSPDGHQYWCIECSNLDGRTKNRHMRRVVSRYKSVKGCVDCGVKGLPGYVYDFDHLDPTNKAGSISNMTKSTRKRLREEIAKCVIVCANCHRIRTHEMGLDE